jgi:hypothetical protein
VRRTWILLSVCFLAGVRAYGTISLVTMESGLLANDSVTWSQLGADQATIPNSFHAISVKGEAITGSFATSTGQVAVACPASPSCSWTTSGTGISAADSLIWTINPNANPGNDGPLTLGLAPPIFSAGAWIQADETDVIGAFTAQIQAFNGGASLGAFNVTSDTNGDPVFIGVKDTVAQINSITFSLTAVPTDSSLNDFALDTVFLDSTIIAPEPGSIFLLGIGLAGMGWELSRRRRAVIHRNLREGLPT